MNQIINMIIRQIMRQFVRQGVNAAMKGGANAWKKRGAGKKRAAAEPIEQDPAISQRRRLHPDERKGDDVLYPTDEYTEDMQPRR